MRRLVEALNAAQTIAVTAHTSPDGDALGSALAIARALGAMGKRVSVIGHDPVSPDYMFLPDTGAWSTPPYSLPSQDVCLMVDACDPHRIGAAEGVWRMAAVRACIDHHVAHPGPGVIAYLDQTAASCAQLVLEVIDALGAPVDRETATLIFCGISTDTGHFMFASADQRAFAAAARMAAYGVDVADFAYRVYRRKTVAKARLMGACLASLTMRCDRRIAAMALTQDDYRKHQAIDSDTEGFVNLGIEISGVDAAILARECGMGEIRISMRTSERLDASAICRAFGGGGHMRAAGCTLFMTIGRAVDAVVSAVEDALVSL